MVDGFRFQNANCQSYLLTHFHSDHTTGLTRGFNAGLIYCTRVTARSAQRPLVPICPLCSSLTTSQDREVYPCPSSPGLARFGKLRQAESQLSP